jgi:hypothetical protein
MNSIGQSAFLFAVLSLAIGCVGDIGDDSTDASSSGAFAAETASYHSDCSLTHPVAHDPCRGTPPVTRGLASCTSLLVVEGQPCQLGARSCYDTRQCPDGRVVVSDYLVCVEEVPPRCFTR